MSHDDTARYQLSIQAESGYESTTTGTCTADQYAACMAILHGKRTAIETELLGALEEFVMEFGECGLTHDARAAIAKATGGAP